MSGYLQHALDNLDRAVVSADPADPDTKRHALIMFGVAALTLDAARAETSSLPQLMNSELDLAIGLVYAIRCGPAHDISEPVWKLKDKYRRVYEAARLHVDLTGVHDQPFAVEHIGGFGTLKVLAEYLMANNVVQPTG